MRFDETVETSVYLAYANDVISRLNFRVSQWLFSPSSKSFIESIGTRCAYYNTPRYRTNELVRELEYSPRCVRWNSF